MEITDRRRSEKMIQHKNACLFSMILDEYFGLCESSGSPSGGYGQLNGWGL